MEVASKVELADVKDKVWVGMSLPCPLRVGDTLLLEFTLHRVKGGRTEELKVNGEYRVLSVVFDTRGKRARQELLVEAKGVTPSWKAIRSDGSESLNHSPRVPCPARAPRALVG